MPELIMLTRTYDLLQWLLPKAEKFPRVYRHSIVQRLTDAALDVLELALEAQNRSGRSRTQALQQCDIALNRLRHYLRLAHDWKWLTPGQYRHVSLMVAEIGRLLGGWIKQNRK